ncbi:thiamine-phosphate kinase [Corynebacterium yudongzhengii]|uniref:Thiamine-monophosphate kinase n=1 Tax=Corynebacterium yudongzhengii TaxID=2080740 RepID=A0A2U1T955_9CORY|nr:thiamine-phosphate kinase [Corynebacterium yudongzhengii]AWB82032.1 thiamine-phosphate kinase [Corynebacterium yudongzhengii]PWC02536.1 thiamine-phosphate kinase [Corynebacterium yudongzhengii]
MNPSSHLEVTVGEIGEKAVIAEIVGAAPSTRNGDDAAVLSHASPNSRTVATTDMLIEGRHFRRDWSTPEEVGKKAITANFADIEAMGARPISALLALAAPPDLPVEFLRRLAMGIDESVSEFAAELVGGDVTQSERLVVSVAAIGELGGNRPALTLDRARAGQKVVANGLIGHSAAGYALLERFGRAGVPEHLDPLVEAHCAPTLSAGRGVVARSAGVTSMTDNSDGLVVDLGAIARASQVGIDLEKDAIAPGPLLIEAGELLDVDPWSWVLSGGEDHTLLATTSGPAPSGFRTIGKVTRSREVTVAGEKPAHVTGWESF